MQRLKYFKFLTRNRMEDLFCYKITKKCTSEKLAIMAFYTFNETAICMHISQNFFLSLTLPLYPSLLLYIYIHSKLSRNVISKSCSIFSFINCIIFLIKVQ